MPDKTYNKVVVDGTTYMDLSKDTATADTILEGYTAHDRNGALITGTARNGAYIATFTYDGEQDEWSCDKTAQEIYEAWAEGKAVIGAEFSRYNYESGNEDCYNLFPLSYCDKRISNGVASYYASFGLSVVSASGDSIYYFEHDVSGDGATYVDESENIVPNSRKINNKDLSSDITLTASDVGALPDTTTIPTKTSDLTNDSGFMTGMTILSYGKSTWNDFLEAYKSNKVVYCRASSNSNPATGSQTRMAFMAYVSNETNPTNVEFQYYRSVSSHSATQQGDQVYVYKLTNTGAWSVIVRESYTKIAVGEGLTTSYSNGVLTISLATT
jgi:hypothetical protein